MNSFFIKPVDKIEMQNIILSLNPLQAVGRNSFPTKILKSFSNDISNQLSEPLNLSFSIGGFPSILKSSKVIPIFRKVSKLKCSNYRPMSLLSNIDKILERIMYHRLCKFLGSKNLICDLQFSFRQKHSTSHALIHLTDKTREQLDKGNFGCERFVDFQKAFDTVDYNILIQKLNYFGVRGTATNWFSSYLENRTQFVSINGYSSDLHFVRCGVPQGSIFGPLLFLVYINDLRYAIKHFKANHFADDTYLLNFSHSVKKMNKQVNFNMINLNNWLNANKICLNVDKTEVVLFKSLTK